MPGRKQKTQKRKGRKQAHTRADVLTQKQISITGEAGYIADRAREFDARVVSLGQLVFFSTQSGDAWMLDPEGKLALCLARNGQKQDYRIVETETQFAIEWNAKYRIDGELFSVMESSGRTVTISGYPTKDILAAGR